MFTGLSRPKLKRIFLYWKHGSRKSAVKIADAILGSTIEQVDYWTETNDTSDLWQQRHGDNNVNNFVNNTITHTSSWTDALTSGKRIRKNARSRLLLLLLLALSLSLSRRVQTNPKIVTAELTPPHIPYSHVRGVVTSLEYSGVTHARARPGRTHLKHFNWKKGNPANFKEKNRPHTHITGTLRWRRRRCCCSAVFLLQRYELPRHRLRVMVFN